MLYKYPGTMVWGKYDYIVVDNTESSIQAALNDGYFKTPDEALKNSTAISGNRKRRGRPAKNVTADVK